MTLNLRSTTIAAALVIALTMTGCSASDGSRANAQVEAGKTGPGLREGAARDGQSRDGQSRDGQGRGGNRPGRGNNGPVAVLVTTVHSKPFSQAIEAVGSARANEAVDITAKNSNRVTVIRFREGQQVRKGDVLVEFDSEQPRAALAEAEAALQDSERQLKRSRELFSTKALSEAQLDQIRTTVTSSEARVAGARSQVNDTIIRAPFPGRVGLRNISVGSFVNPGTVITTLDDTSVIKVDFSVPEVFLAEIDEGLVIQARTSAYPQSEFQGKISGIDSRLDAVSRAIMVRAQIDNRDGRLKPGMFMTVKVERPEQPALMIPEQALVPESGRKFVFVVREDQAAKVEVQTGRRRPGEVEVLSGLSDGDVIVVEGTQKVRDGGKVKTLPADEASA